MSQLFQLISSSDLDGREDLLLHKISTLHWSLRRADSSLLVREMVRKTQRFWVYHNQIDIPLSLNLHVMLSSSWELR